MKGWDMSSFGSRILRATRLDPGLYREVEKDPASIIQACALVLLSGISGGIGVLLPGAPMESFLYAVLGALGGWLICIFFVYFIGVKLLSGPMMYYDAGELLRGAAFASAPGLIRAFGVFPPLRWGVFFLALFWMFAAMMIVVRQVFQYSSNGLIFFICILGFFFQGLFAAGIFFLQTIRI